MLREADKFRYEYMRLARIRQVLQECPVAVIPSGLLEWHGEHNAIGLDGLKGYYICERAMLKLGNGALFPINWVGTYGFIRYPGSVVYDAPTTRNVFIQLYREAIKLGFKVIAILTGHYGQWQMEQLGCALTTVQKEAQEQGIQVRLLGWKPPDLVQHIFGGDHAREFETSMLMRVGEAWNLDLVDVSGCKVGEENVPKYQLASEEGVPLREPPIWTWPTDLQDRSICSAERGEKLIHAISAGMVLEIVEKLEEIGIEYKPAVSIENLEEIVINTKI